MSSRETILQSVRSNMPPAEKHPEDWGQSGSNLDLRDQFSFHLDAIGGVTRFYTSKTDAIDALSEISQDILIRDLVRGITLEGKNVEPDVTVIEARFAVAENGAVFVTDREVNERNNLFLGQKLIALVPEDGLMSNMHEAYETIDLTSTGFGVFIAGPSATADIAQILVRGAHGPSEMEVWFYSNG